MSSDEPSYPWWARVTGGNRGYALVLAIVYTLLFVVDAVRWLIRFDGWVGLLSVAFLVLAVWAWAVVVYLHRRPSSGGRRGW